MNAVQVDAIGFFASFGLPISPEATIGALGILAICCGALYAFARWLFTGPRTPDPWGPEIEKAVEGEGAVPLCPRCLAPQEHNGWFCPECGSTVGRYCNYLPAVYIFSIGEAVRAGLSRRNRHPSLLLVGYALVALAYFPFVLALPYLILAIRKANRPMPEQDSGPLPTN